MTVYQGDIQITCPGLWEVLERAELGEGSPVCLSGFSAWPTEHPGWFTNHLALITFIAEAASASDAESLMRDELARYVGMLAEAPASWEQTVRLTIEPAEIRGPAEMTENDSVLVEMHGWKSIS